MRVGKGKGVYGHRRSNPLQHSMLFVTAREAEVHYTSTISGDQALY